MREDACWEKYAAHLKDWYVTTYSGREGSTRCINNGRLIKKIVILKKEGTSYDTLKSGGVSEFAAKTIVLYIRNTKQSYMSKCIPEIGGFSVDVACMSDSDCPRGYRCRGVGKDSECVPEGEKPTGISLPDVPKIPLPSIPDGSAVKKSLQVTGIILIGVVLVIVWMMTGKGERGI